MIEQITFLMFARLLDIEETADEKREQRTGRAFRRRLVEAEQDLRKRISSASSTSPGRSCGPCCGLLLSPALTTFERAAPSVALTCGRGR
ncbi:MAG: hypothetical protein WB611_26800 [Stellaceae bacterium]